ncbi:MAG: cell division protein DivIVA, partial [Chloroflexota bacterium]
AARLGKRIVPRPRQRAPEGEPELPGGEPPLLAPPDGHAAE